MSYLFGIVFIGFIIRGIAIYQMRKNHLWRIVNPVNICTKGIYSIVRHPMYLGTLFMFIPLWYLADSNIWTTVIFSMFIYSFLLDRIDREEQNMIFQYGNEYIEYMKKTKMLIPYIW